MSYRILSHTWSAVSDFSQRYDARIDAVEEMARRQANAPDVLFELVTEDQFRAWLDREPA